MNKEIKIDGLGWAIIISAVLAILRVFNIIDLKWYYILAPVFIMLALFLLGCMILGITIVFRYLFER